MALATADDPNAVPIQFIKPYIRRWMEDYMRQHPELTKGSTSGEAYVKAQGNGAIDVLGFQVGIAGRNLCRYMNSNLVENVPFDLADRIVINVAGPMAWRRDENLRPYYERLELLSDELGEGFELPEGYDLKSLPRKKQLLWENAVREKEWEEEAA